MSSCITVILGGGRGTRLAPLTSSRSKPAVPLAGKYRLIDIPLSNAINSRMSKIFVLTQFRSNSLNTHVMNTYRFDMFSKMNVEILTAEQTEARDDWFQGTADAFRKQLHHMMRDDRVDEVLILSGDHLYRMDYRELLDTHRRAGADATVSCLPVRREDCDGFGVMRVDERGRVTGFREKPRDDEDLSALELPASAGLGDKRFLASMGVYVFSRRCLEESLADPNMVDFGRDILPSLLDHANVVAHTFHGYWEDIGTIGAFYEANIALARPTPDFHFFHPEAPIYTHQRILPPSTVRSTQVVDSLISDGCFIEAEHIARSVIGVRTRIRARSVVRDSIFMGADYIEDAERQHRHREAGHPGIGLGAGCVVERAIVDKNARIGDNCVIRGRVGARDAHFEGWSLVDGIAIVHKNAIIPNDSELIG